MAAKHTIVLDVVGLEYGHIASGMLPNIAKLASGAQLARMEPPFPAVTCTVQASVLSGKYPDEHGIIANGLYDRDSYSVSFWEQPSRLVKADRIWDIAKSRNPAAKTAVLFWQNTMYAQSDVVVTPRPLHTDNGMVMWCYSKPVGYYEELKEKLGEFDLASYWGPLASHRSSEWICKAAEYTLEKQRPDTMLVYLPHVDYSAQRFGKGSAQARDDLKKADEMVGSMVQKTSELGIRDQTEFVIFSEYSFNDVTGAVPINIVLRDAGLLATRIIQGREYVDLEFSKAFAMVDHQVAHIYVQEEYFDRARRVVEDTDGVSQVLHSKEQKRSLRIDHPRSGDIIAISDIDRWFSYYWWYKEENAPDFAGKVDIHRKPGYDPVELFFDPKTKSVPLDSNLVRGSHGRPADPSGGEGYAVYVSTGRRAAEKDGIVKCVDVVGSLMGET
jgi:predicted AlkP superfamily pyrophosphatase or phosphodiesterase